MIQPSIIYAQAVLKTTHLYGVTQNGLTYARMRYACKFEPCSQQAAQQSVMLRVLQRQLIRSHPLRCLSASTLRAFATETESAIQEKLQSALKVENVEVRDTSGGCGTMFEIKITAEEFKNKSIIQQHKVVTKVLQEDISQWHGFTLLTSAPSSSS